MTKLEASDLKVVVEKAPLRPANQKLSLEKSIGFTYYPVQFKNVVLRPLGSNMESL